MSVRTNWIESRFALLNGAPTFLTLAERGATRPHEVALELPAAWKTSVTSLAPVAGEAHRYRAPTTTSWSTRRSSLGNPTVHRFEVDGKPHVLANEGEAGVFDGERAAADVARIVAEHARFWGGLPYERYAFLNVLSEAGGGLEHKNSTVLMASRWATGTRRAYVNWLTLAAHEHFHAWNVKRLRPVELGPFDYERENPTTSLWIAEGFTDYYEHLLVRRAGLTTDAELIDGDRLRHPRSADDARPACAAGRDRLARRLDQVLPPRREHAEHGHQLLHEGRRHRASCSTPRSAQATNGGKSLDDVMRLAYSRYSGAKGFTRSRVPGGRARGRRAATSARGGRRCCRRPRSWTTTRRSTGSACASSRSISRRRRTGQGVARRHHEERRRPPGRDAGPPRHAGAPGRRQRRRRDPGHRRLPRPRRRARSPARAVRARAAR